jgi:metallo-beta-lactamase family protein
MKLTFLGAAGEVTGSCYLVETGGARFLIDCGMFQGGRFAERRNYARFAFDPAAVDFVLLSHAHIDHSGLLPRLVALGFKGPVYATHATADLLGVMLPDSAHLQEKEAERDNRGRVPGKHRPPLYTVRQAQASLRRLRPLEYDTEVRPHSSVRCMFRDAGHILGSAILEIWLKAGQRETKLVFSGDLGQPGHPIVNDPAPVETADVLLVESTYGDRVHKNLAQTLDEFAYALTDTLRSRMGNVVIPAFAVGRTQDILHFIGALHRQKRLPPMDVYVDSPMAVAATRITLAHPELFDRDAVELAEWLKHGKGGPRVHFTERVEDSMLINAIRSGAVIISASGMCDGGRIRHHLRYNLPRPECAIVFTGFQASGTLGRRIVDGAKTVRIFGEICPVRAKVFTIGGLSAHADQTALLGWLARFKRAPRQCWVVHGEPLAAHALRDEIRARFGWRAEVPAPGQGADLAG